MKGQNALIAKIAGLFFLVFGPYIVLAVAIGVTAPRGNPARVLGLVALVYLVLGIWACTAFTRKLLNREANAVSPSVVGKARETYGKPDFPPLKIETAWISSLEHLARFQALPWSAKQLGNMPDDFPTVWIQSRRFPILYFAHGALALDQNEFRFAACDPSTPSKFSIVKKLYSNLDTALQFTLTPEQILSVSRFDMSRVTSAPVRLPFIRIQASTGDMRDFLVCAGSDDPSEIAAETENLFIALQSFTAQEKTVLAPS